MGSAMKAGVKRAPVYGYLANGGQHISVLTLSYEGELTQIQEVALNEQPVSGDVAAGRFMGLCLSPDRRYLFATDRTPPYSVHSFAVDGRDGLLTRVGTAPLVDSSPYISTDRTGRFLLAAYNPTSRKRRSGHVSVSVIGGGFVMAPHQVIRTPPKTHAILPDASNRFVFAPSCDGDVMTCFGFDAVTGELEPAAISDVNVRPGSGPRHVVVHPGNRFIYLLNEYDATIYTYQFDPRTGALSERQVATVFPADIEPATNPRAGDLRITPDGKWLYAAVRANSTIAAVAVDQRTGDVSLTGHFPVDREPRGFSIDPFGRFLVASGLMTNTAVTYAIDPRTGALTRLGEITGLDAPNWLELVRLP